MNCPKCNAVMGYYDDGIFVCNSSNCKIKINIYNLFKEHEKMEIAIANIKDELSNLEIDTIEDKNRRLSCIKFFIDVL